MKANRKEADTCDRPVSAADGTVSAATTQPSKHLIESLGGPPKVPTNTRTERTNRIAALLAKQLTTTTPLAARFEQAKERLRNNFLV
jgi:hypothetical protein